MRQRSNGAAGRPEGTDGSDFSYRMVVDSRYQRVARRKSLLRYFFLFQLLNLPTIAFNGVQAAQLLAALVGYIKTSAAVDLSAHRLEIGAAALGLFSLLIGEMGRRRSRAGLLRFFVVVSSVATLLQVNSAVGKNLGLQGAQNASFLEALLGTPQVLLALSGLLCQLVILGMVKFLIDDMSPPKRAS